MNRVSIPPKDRVEWQKMITGEIEHKFRNYVLQMKVHHARREINENSITLEDAIESLYTLCQKYIYAVQNDFEDIFKEW